MEQREPLYTWECKLVQPLENNIEVFQKANSRISIWPRNSTPGHTSEKKLLIHKDTCTPMFKVALFTITKMWEPPKCPSTDEWIQKVWYMHSVEHSVIKITWCSLSVDHSSSSFSVIWLFHMPGYFSLNAWCCTLRRIGIIWGSGW